MRKLLSLTLGTIALVAFAGAAFGADAETGGKVGSLAVSSTYLAVVVAMAIAAVGCAIGQGLGLKAACEGTARNPEAGGKIMVTLILGLAFIESLGIYSLVVNLLILFVNPLS